MESERTAVQRVMAHSAPEQGRDAGQEPQGAGRTFSCIKFLLGVTKLRYTPSLAQTEMLRTVLGVAGASGSGECCCPSPFLGRRGRAWRSPGSQHKVGRGMHWGAPTGGEQAMRATELQLPRATGEAPKAQTLFIQFF